MFQNIGIIRGIDVIVNNLMCVSNEFKQFKFPKSKKKRIRKKWTKRKENYRLTEVHKMFKQGNRLFVSQRDYNEKITKLFKDYH